MEIKNAFKFLGVISLFIVIFFVYLFIELKKNENNNVVLPLIKRENKNEIVEQATTTEMIEDSSRPVSVEQWEAGQEERIEKAEEMIGDEQVTSAEWESEKSERLKKLEELRNMKK